MSKSVLLALHWPQLVAGLLVLFFLSQPLVSLADQVSPAIIRIDDVRDDRYVAQVRLHSKAEMEAFLSRADQLTAGAVADPDFPPIEVVLHGQEVLLFLRQNYAQNQQLINKAAQLDALNVINIQVCETWMRINQKPLQQLPSFVETVPFGPAVEKDLVKKGYVYF